MLIEYIERMRKEPPEVRRRAVFVWTVGIVAVILLIYAVYHLAFSASGDRTPDRPSNLARPYDAVAE